MKSNDAMFFKFLTVSISVGLLLLLTNCSVSSNTAANSGNQIASAPPAAVEAATNAVRSKVTDYHISDCPKGVQESRDFRVYYASQNAVSAADSANGLEDRRSFIMMYIYICNGENNWKDGTAFPTVEKKKDGVWELAKPTNK